MRRASVHKQQRNSLRTSVRQSVQLDASTCVVQYEKSTSSLKVIAAGTQGNPLFEPLSEQQKKVVYGAMFDVQCQSNETIIQQGERGDLFYVVESGQYAAYLAASGPKPVKHYKRGSGFGELALLYNSPRAATVKCIEGGKLWAIDRSVFSMIMVASNQREVLHTKEVRALLAPHAPSPPPAPLS